MASSVTQNGSRGGVYRAATATFDFQNPALALGGLLRLASELMKSPRAALYEVAEAEGGFSPRFAHGVPVTELGRLASSSDHPVLKEVLSKRRASSSGSGRSALGLPLGAGTVACAPCISGGQTIGMLFVGKDEATSYPSEALETLEVLASRAGEVLAFARQTATQSYLFLKLSLLYQAAHAISGTRDRQEAIRETAAHLLKATTADSCEALILDEGEGLTTRFRQQHGKSPQIGRAHV